MEKIKNFKIEQIPVWKIVVAATGGDPYNMDRVILVENHPDYGDDFIVITGNHCSCYDFNSTEWEAITYDKEELTKLAQGWMASGWNAERVAAPMILDYLKT